MEIVLNRTIVLSDSVVHIRELTKKYYSQVIPHKGDYITSTAFESVEEVEAQRDFIDYEKNRCNVYLEPLTFESDDVKLLNHVVESYIKYGWECNL